MNNNKLEKLFTNILTGVIFLILLGISLLILGLVVNGAIGIWSFVF